MNKLTPAQLERLSLLLEELGESQQAIGKILRHGYDSYHPDKDPELNNRFDLEVELGQVQAVMELMFTNSDINPEHLELHKTHKLVQYKLGIYLHHQE